jgi:hypothetical protein
MKSLKTRLAAAFAATSIALGAPLAANADGGLDSLLGWIDLQAAILNVVGNTVDLKNLNAAGPIDINDIVIKDTADVTGILQKIWVENVGANNAGILNDSFNDVSVLDGAQILNLNDVLNDSVDDNTVVIPVAVDVLSDGTCVVWNCSHCGD